MRRLSGGKKKRHSKADVTFYTLLMALPILQIVIFYFGVNFQSICMAFQNYDVYNNEYTWEVSKNISRFVSDISVQGFWEMVKNSLIVWLCTSLTGTILAIVFAYYVYRRRFMSNVFKFVLFMPSVLPGIFLAIMYQKFVGLGVPAFMEYLCETEMLNYFSTSTGNVRFTLITLFTVWISFGAQVLVYTGAMDRVDVSTLEAGRVDGTTTWQEFIYIILPDIISTVTVFLIMGIASIFTNQNNLFNFLGGVAMPQEKTIGYYLYVLVYQDSAKSGYCYAAFLGVIFTLIAAPLAFGARKLFDREKD